MRLSAMTGGNEAIRSTHVIVLLLIGCAGGRVPASRAPQYNRLLELVKASYGEPLHNRHGVEFWSADTMDIYINHRSFYNEAPSLNLSDARVCERFERLVHREHPAPASVNPQGNHCWVQPDTGSMAVADSIARASEPPAGTRVRYQMPGDTTWAEGRG